MVDFPCDDESICVCVRKREESKTLSPFFWCLQSTLLCSDIIDILSLSLSISLWVIFSHITYCQDFHHSVFNTVGKYHTLDLKESHGHCLLFFCFFVFDMLLHHKLPVRLIWQKNFDAIYVNFPFCG